VKGIQYNARTCYILLAFAAQLTFHTWLRCGNTLQPWLTVVIGIDRVFATVHSKIILLLSLKNSVMCGTTESSKNFKLLSTIFPQKLSFWEYGQDKNSGMEKLCIQYIVLCVGYFLAAEEKKDNCLNMKRMGARLGVSLC
jgi:hypothetical protein